MAAARLPSPKAPGLYYPQHKDPRLNEDFRIAYDHIYSMRSQLEQALAEIAKLKGGGGGQK